MILKDIQGLQPQILYLMDLLFHLLFVWRLGIYSIFPYLLRVTEYSEKIKKVQIRSFTGLYFYLFGMNAGKYRPEKTPHLDTFCSVQIILECTWRLKLWFIQCISVINVVVDLVRVKKIYLVCLSIYWTNKNGRLYQGFTDSYIYRPYGLWKKSSYLDLIEKEFWLHHHYLCNAPMQKNT